MKILRKFPCKKVTNFLEKLQKQQRNRISWKQIKIIHFHIISIFTLEKLHLVLKIFVNFQIRFMNINERNHIKE